MLKKTFVREKTKYLDALVLSSKLYPQKTNLLECVPAIFCVRFSAMAGMDLGNEKQMSTNVATKVILCHRDIFTVNNK